ncbi:hypothetical protein ACJMK2_016788 [Sinanodonta woodiana]|uniref:G-protein coupled receptors family 3 profile domain-containing protein n=1 Tax=Sinanodonta woodiana TaxID=1069815 RepID=A0ABD3UUU4_SINWO
MLISIKVFGQERILLFLFLFTTSVTGILDENGSLLMPEGKRSATIIGDISLGGLFPVHHEGVRNESCGKINHDRGIQRLEAMLFTIDEINKNSTILPGITLGAQIFDTCARGTYALEKSLEYIRGFFSSLDASEFVCEDGSKAKAKHHTTPVVGVIGGSYSTVSIQVANLLRLFKIPQISYASTSAALSDKSRYEYFVRTVPPDRFQAKAMVDLVHAFNWTYVSTVASEGEYGVSGIEYFQQEASAKNICFAATLKISAKSSKAEFDSVINHLLKNKHVKVVILFLRVEDARGLLEAANRRYRNGQFLWIAADGWGTQEAPVKGNERAAQGALTIELQSTVIKEFDDYFMKLDPHMNHRNPWFREYWEEIHNCKWPNEKTPYTDDRILFCTGNEILSQAKYKQETKVQFVYDAVLAMALALDKMIKDDCPVRNKKCPALLKINGEKLLKQYLLNTSFDDGYGATVTFDESGDALGRYNIMNYKLNRETREYGYDKVGTWSSSLEIDLDKIVWPGETKDIPESRCSKPCKPYEFKHVGENGDLCCWICMPCQSYEYLKNEFKCEDCGPGRWPTVDRKGCYDLPENYMQWNTVYVIVPVCLSGLGIVTTLTVIIIFLRNNDTPIVRASGKELSYMLLCGCLLCYLMTFILVTKPSTLVCIIQRFGVGFGFAVIYSSLLTKTNRISRIFVSARKTAQRPSFISPKSQIAIASILISLQVIVTIIWLVLEPPGTRLYFPNGRRDEVILKCRTEDVSFLASLIYNIILIIICTCYAIKTRKIPENFNESKFIGFTMYTTCIIWLAFVPIYFGTLNSFQVQITTLCVSVSLSATVALGCLFAPKIYIIVFQPEKNVRKLTMNSSLKKMAASTLNNSENPAELMKLNMQNFCNHFSSINVTTTETETDKESMTSL